jgi:hypothetical protein
LNVIERLGETTLTVYAELLDQLRGAPLVPHSGSFVSKEIGGTRYWYVQRKHEGKLRQIYLGVESPELLRIMKRADTARESQALDERRRRELVSMLIGGGMAAESGAVASVLTTIADAGLFRAGAVLVGTQAFRCIANLLGVRSAEENLRSADGDLGQRTISIALGDMRVDLLEELRKSDPRFAAVPELDPRHPSTSFKVRGRDLRVDVLIPGSRDGARSVYLAHLNAAAQPLVGLAFLLEETTEAAVIGDAGILVSVPSPARFALHKLWVSQRRPVSETAKSRKDHRQAEQILEVLLADRPEDIARAWRQVPRAMAPSLRKAAKQLEPTVLAAIAEVVQDAALSRR